MSLKKFFVLLSLGFFLTACGLPKTEGLPQNNTEDALPVAEKTGTADLKADYQQGVKDALAGFFESGQAPQAKEKILLLKTPEEYLRLHLDLVLALDQIDQGTMAGDREKIDSGRQKINQLTREYPFIK